MVTFHCAPMVMVCCLLTIRFSCTSHYINKVLITIANNEVKAVNKLVERHGLKYRRQILDIYQQEEVHLPVEHTRSKLSQQFLKHVQRRSLAKQFKCSHYGMHITDAWAMGYKGENIVVGIVDTGIEATHSDLAANMDLDLSRNFVKEQSADDVNPDILLSYQEYDIDSDHGNNCAGLVASIQGNDICCSGVAPFSKIAALKFVTLNDPSIYDDVVTFRPADLAEALVFKLNQIHIYLNSHGPEDFAKSTTVINEAFIKGVKEGRDGKGSIYIFATGNKGHFKDANLDGYVNSVYTIAISSIGKNGTIPQYAQPGTCILASTYGEGLHEFADFMVTTSHRNSCTAEFKRTSASAAVASCMTAITLQANPDVTWRDIQHIIINTSSIAGLEGQESATTNAAGFSYHPYFGFGLMNASALVHITKLWTNVPPQKVLHSSVRDKTMKKETHSLSLEICEDSSECLSFIEHVVADIEYSSYYDKAVELQLCAPTKTCSYFLTKQTSKQLQTPKRVKRSWKFMSLQFWGEKPTGTWELQMFLNDNVTGLLERPFNLLFVNLTVFGYSESSASNVDGLKDIAQYASEKVEEMAEVLKVPGNQTQTVSEIMAFIGKLLLFTVTVSLIFIYLAPAERRREL